jgi:hypothetical protein
MKLPRIGTALAFGFLALLGLSTVAGNAEAAPPWVDRGITLPQGIWTFDLGLGVARRAENVTGSGVNFDLAVGLSQDLALGFRTGARFGDRYRWVQADERGRLYDTQTYGTGVDSLANPELTLRYRFVDAEIPEVGVESRLILPVESGTRLGVLVGLPVALHFGSLRLDSGVFLPVLFYDPVFTSLSVPVKLWIQPTSKVFLGPIADLRWQNQNDRTSFLLGFGFGYSFARAADFKVQTLFPSITETAGARDVSFGVGVQLRIE